MNPEQARVVATALEDLPGNLDPALLVKAEEVLVDLARVHDPAELATLGGHILSVIAPEIGDELDRKRLDEAERTAAQKRRLTLSFDGPGTAHGRFRIPTAQARMLHKLLLAFAAPGHLNATKDPASGEKKAWVNGRPSAQKLGATFCELIETYLRTNASKLGRVDGNRHHHPHLPDPRPGQGHVGRRHRDHRRPSPTPGLRGADHPRVLGTPGQVLDLGTAARQFTAAQTYALHLRDGGCTTRGCDWPPGCATPTTTPPALAPRPSGPCARSSTIGALRPLLGRRGPVVVRCVRFPSP